jgi:hypothetical protein
MAGVFGFAALLWSTGLPCLNHPFFDSNLTARASQDRFVLAVAVPETAKAVSWLRGMLAEADAMSIEETVL